MSYRSRFITKYLNPLEVQAEIEDLVDNFPDFCRLEKLPLESHGYWGVNQEAHGRHSMYMLHITSPNGSENKPAVLLMRSHHAREWINAIAVVESARQLLENYRPDDNDPRVQKIVTMLDQVEFLIVPEGNPDGARLSFFDPGRRMWRKNLHPPTSGTCFGVDCNRNYPRYWGEAGSSADPCVEIYRGSTPLSEPEAGNIAWLAQRYRNIIFAIDSHSSGQAIFRPNPRGGRYVSELPVSQEDEAIYLHLERAMNRHIRLIQGINYSTGTTSNHAGTTDEFLFFEHQIFGFNLECGREFQPPINDAITSSLEVAQAFQALGWCATGATGLNIDSLMGRRLNVDLDFSIDQWRGENPIEPWEIEVLSSDYWLKYYVKLLPLCSDKAVDESLKLMNEGYDVLEYSEREIELITSITGIDTLLHKGYTPSLTKNLYIEYQ